MNNKIEDVIFALKCMSTVGPMECIKEKCPFYGVETAEIDGEMITSHGCDPDEIDKEAAAILEHMIPIAPRREEIELSDRYRHYSFCQRCGNQIFRGMDNMYCPKCGQAIKWEE